MRHVKHWLVGISLAANQLVNALTGGSAGQTVSFRAEQARANGSRAGAAVCRVLEAADFHRERPNEDHCAKAARHFRERLRVLGSR
jgi:hypothetical protein